MAPDKEKRLMTAY